MSERKPWNAIMRASTRRGVLLCAVSTVLAHGEDARGAEGRVEAALDTQFYTLTSPFGEPTLRRRRYTQSLGLTVWDLGERGPEARSSLTFRARLRLDADLGQEGAERDPDGDRFIPGLRRAPIDLMYAYLEGDDYLDGYVGFRVGRQYTSDALGFWSFDGAALSVTTPAFVRVGAYAGFEQRGGLQLLSTSRFESEGVYRGDRRNIEGELWPSFLESSALAPAYGFTLESEGLTWLETALSYRAVQNRDNVTLLPFADASGRIETYDRPRVSSQRLGYSANLSLAELGSLGGMAAYDFYGAVLSDALAHLDVYVTPRLAVGAEYEYYYPTFDGDAIWNWFAHSGTTSALGRARVDLLREWDAALALGVRVFHASDDAAKGELNRVLDITSRYRWETGRVSARGLVDTGDLQRRVGGDIDFTQQYGEGVYETRLLVSLYDWANELRQDRDATSFGYVLGAGLYPLGEGPRDARVGVEWEHTMNRLVGDRFRVLGTVSMALGL